MERARPLKLRAAALAAVGAGLCFIVGWILAAPGNQGRGRVPVVENKEAPSNTAAPDLLGQTEPGSALSGGGTFEALIAMDAEAARLKPEDWPRLWQERMRTGEHYGLTRAWVKADPRGALKASLAAADELSLSDQEGYAFQYLGAKAINELFSRDLPSALPAMRDWREKYGEYPSLDCLHLLVSGDAAQKAALVEFLSTVGSETVGIRETGVPLRVLEALNQPGMPARPELQQQIVYEAVQSQPAETVDWILRQTGPMSSGLMERALNGLRTAEDERSPRETTEAMERLLEVASPDMADDYAEEFAHRKAAYDPEGARRWAEEHVPEARLKQVLERIAK